MVGFCVGSMGTACKGLVITTHPMSCSMIYLHVYTCICRDVCIYIYVYMYTYTCTRQIGWGWPENSSNHNGRSVVRIDLGYGSCELQSSSGIMKPHTKDGHRTLCRDGMRVPTKVLRQDPCPLKC